MTQYLVYRHGANAANQSMELKRPVAIVEADNANDACRTAPSPPGIHATEFLVLEPSVHAYSNQSFSAKPLSRASKKDRERVNR